MTYYVSENQDFAENSGTASSDIMDIVHSRLAIVINCFSIDELSEVFGVDLTEEQFQVFWNRFADIETIIYWAKEFKRFCLTVPELKNIIDPNADQDH